MPQMANVMEMCIRDSLGSYIKYVHVKDSIVKDGKCEYRMMGEGDLPILEMLDALEMCIRDRFRALYPYLQV